MHQLGNPDWARTKGKIGFHGSKTALNRQRVRSFDGHEVALPTRTAAQAEDWLSCWAMNLMLINVSTRKLRRAVRRWRALGDSNPCYRRERAVS